MRIGKAHAAFGQRINIGCVNLATFTAITVHIPNPQIVGENKNNVREECGVNTNRQQEQQDQVVHGQVLSKMRATAKWIYRLYGWFCLGAFMTPKRITLSP